MYVILTQRTIPGKKGDGLLNLQSWLNITAIASLFNMPLRLLCCVGETRQETGTPLYV